MHRGKSSTKLRNSYAYMVLSIAGVEYEPESKGEAGELYVKKILPPIVPAALSHSSEWSQTTDQAGGAST